VRQGRLTETGEAYYHAMSRVVDRRLVLTDDEKERFRKLLRRVEGFSGVDVMTHSVLGNHFPECLSCFSSMHSYRTKSPPASACGSADDSAAGRLGLPPRPGIR
jgi:hypothetical protein